MPNSPYRPRIGEVVRDLGRKDPDGRPLEGIYLDTLGAAAYLRPERGGCEWSTKPENIQPLDAA
ncbi:hypothetical protein KV557_21505 [Kitasatospora aureofaciens]|uniref:hypothetical protein n=1 Tax=Kitasatospora aureofaciens TaxID=1894 RepID=UPI001C45BB00|nr:hypothetical protein [Kitasatospora aureofaciens]MBV6699642.1 hypothetical protein [Kitasatospora aureofaciens]